MSRICFLAVSVLALIPLTANAQLFRRPAQSKPTTLATVTVPPKVEPKASVQPKVEPVQVDTFEVERWGDRVVVTDGHAKSPEDILQSMATAPPVDDSDMFRFTIFGKKDSHQLVGLVKTFEQDRFLAPYVATNPATNRAWAHIQVIHTDDVMQQWRLKAHGIATNRLGPILILQAPVNGHKGDPAIVIDRIDFDNPAVGGTKNAEQLAKRIQTSLTSWTKRLAAQGFQTPKAAVDNFYGLVSRGEDRVPPPTKGGHEQTPPWGPVAPPPSTPVNPQWPVNGPGVPEGDDSVLTIAQIQEAAPGASPAFILSQYQLKVKDKAAVALAWLVEQAKLVPPVVTPTVPVGPVPVVPADPTQIASQWALIALLILRALEFFLPMMGFPGTVVKTLREILERVQKK